MKKSKVVILATALILTSSLLITCQKEGNEPNTTESEVAFAINISHPKKASVPKSAMAYDLSDADKIILTIQFCDGSSTKYTHSKVKIEQMSGNFYTQKIVLKTGCYKLAEFLILNANDSTIFAAPLIGSQEAQNVSNPLPIEFSVTKNITSSVSVEVLSTQGKKPEDFGLNTFPIIEVKTFGFMIGVADNESGKLLTAKLTVSNGSYSYVQNLDSILNNVVTVKDSLNNYTLTVEKSGYKTYAHTYSLDSLKVFKSDVGNLPLLVELDKNISSTDFWITKATMPTARHALAAGVINNKLYVVGGANLNSCNDGIGVMEEYDPSTNIWATKASLPTKRGGLTCAVVNNKLYAIAGHDNVNPCNSTYYSTVEEYDPSTDTWTSKANIPQPYFFASATSVNGKIYVAGGWTGYGGYVNYLHEYDPSVNTWITKATPPEIISNAAAVSLNGKIYFAGGSNTSGIRNTLYEYDPSTNSWATKANLPVALCQISAAVIGEKLFIAGGYDGTNYVNTLYRYDPVTNTWTGKANMSSARTSLASGVINNKLYVVGGYTSTLGILNVLEEYNP